MIPRYPRISGRDQPSSLWLLSADIRGYQGIPGYPRISRYNSTSIRIIIRGYQRISVDVSQLQSAEHDQTPRVNLLCGNRGPLSNDQDFVYLIRHQQQQTFVLTTKLKSLFVFLSVCLSVCLSIFLTSC